MAVKKAGYDDEKVLCGVGIAEGEDARKAVELLVEGILVSSSAAGTKDWAAKIEEFAMLLVCAGIPIRSSIPPGLVAFSRRAPVL